MTPELTQEEREARSRYFREWRAKNRDKVREYNRRYWQRRTAKGREDSTDSAAQAEVS